MRELRSTVITTVAGTVGMTVGGAIGMVVTRGFADAAMLGIPFNTRGMLALAGVGFVIGPSLALRAGGYRLPETTAALAALWVLLLFLAVGPTIKVMGPSWTPLPLVVASLAIARLIAEPLSAYLSEEEEQAEAIPAWSSGR